MLQKPAAGEWLPAELSLILQSDALNGADISRALAAAPAVLGLT